MSSEVRPEILALRAARKRYVQADAALFMGNAIVPHGVIKNHTRAREQWGLSLLRLSVKRETAYAAWLAAVRAFRQAQGSPIQSVQNGTA